MTDAVDLFGLGLDLFSLCAGLALGYALGFGAGVRRAFGPIFSFLAGFTDYLAAATERIKTEGGPPVEADDDADPDRPAAPRTRDVAPKSGELQPPRPPTRQRFYR